MALIPVRAFVTQEYLIYVEANDPEHLRDALSSCLFVETMATIAEEMMAEQGEDLGWCFKVEPSLPVPAGQSADLVVSEFEPFPFGCDHCEETEQDGGPDDPA